MPHLELVATLEGHQDRVWQASWHPTKTILATCSGDKTVRLWTPISHDNFEHWQCIETLEGAHKRTIRSVDWSPTGNELATASFDATTGIWENDPRDNDWECVATLEGHENEIKSVAWSSTGALLATCSRDKSVWIWEVESDNDFECLSVLQEHTQDVKMVAWHPKLEILASASYDDTIKIWKEDEDDWYCADTLEGHTSTVWSLDFNQEGDQIVSASDDQTLRIWKMYKPDNDQGVMTHNGEATWKTICTLSGFHDRCIYSVSWSKVNGYIASVSGDNSIRIFEKDTEATVNENEPTYKNIATKKDAHGVYDINGVSWFPTKLHQDWLSTVGDDGLVRIWKVVLD
ncbi:WD40-repeat-containing domain protein [Helicostylum pulchrum]|uniref:Probable cytosolic iron-sulfur protein assembly protein 1 n=1 Tax=Helicostylum pulchrum TaxID=562976 RepID=A0ABP9YEI3_9FUNG|nr:WD40-repeat-containing domain protein [Helicostylum pulchrum]